MFHGRLENVGLSLYKRLWSSSLGRTANKKLQKLFPFVTMEEKMEMYPFNLRAIVVAAFMPLLKVNTLNAFRMVELQWLEHLWDYENMSETGVVRANEC